MKNAFFWRLCLSLLAVLLLFGAAMTYISFLTSQTYQEEANQKLHANLAQFTTDHLETFDENGQMDTTAITKVMESMMVINPDVEVYLLDTVGNILAHVAPYKEVVRTSVDLTSIKAFISSKGENFIRGNDPRDFQKEKIFSAAEVKKGETLLGYYYIILASEERESVFADLIGTYSLNSFIRLLLLAVVISFSLGFLIFWFQTKHLQSITKGIESFKEGNFDSQIPEDRRSVFSGLSETFNAMARQIKLQFEKIQSIDSFRRELVANISHDLRTPLSIIQGYTETLQIKKNELSEADREDYLENINESTRKLKGLVNQLFELSKLENNQIKLVKEPFPLDELVADLLSRYKVMFHSKEIALEFIHGEGGSMVYGDVGLVERVIQNLVDNALKFTPKGGLIKIAVESSNSEGIRFSISDTGIGIHENELSAIFERYHTHRDEEKRMKGTGLGLAIANRIVELHNSTISVKSKLNQGTVFSFNLPAYQVSAV